ncbi:hypothetical protein L9F63_005423 [Diploptera punctata]|uniref:Insulin-like domain-containing protein n=1 Tax=Diploptera punctata TaxID=6984 RepID=A0AAD7ZDJ0_DIPPU|nr:hypothetical protein L9F63_005423 [Diploptera punctata]
MGIFVLLICCSATLSSTERPQEVALSSTERPQEVALSSTERPQEEVALSSTERPQEVALSSTERPQEVALSSTERPQEETSRNDDGMINDQQMPNAEAREIQYKDGDLPEDEHESNTSPFIARSSAHSILKERHRRGITDECCYNKGCTIKELKSYCED